MCVFHLALIVDRSKLEICLRTSPVELGTMFDSGRELPMPPKSLLSRNISLSLRVGITEIPSDLSTISGRRVGKFLEVLASSSRKFPVDGWHEMPKDPWGPKVWSKCCRIRGFSIYSLKSPNLRDSQFATLQQFQSTIWFSFGGRYWDFSVQDPPLETTVPDLLCNC